MSENTIEKVNFKKLGKALKNKRNKETKKCGDDMKRTKSSDNWWKNYAAYWTEKLRCLSLKCQKVNERESCEVSAVWDRQ